jgi:ABC-type oligopeptide transport system substrate-binding subunit
MRWRSILSLVALGAILAGLLAACGDSTPTPAPVTTAAASTTAAAPATTAASAATTAAATATKPATTVATTAAAATTASNATGKIDRVVTGGTFRWTMTGEPDGLDPGVGSAEESVNVMTMLFDGLTQFDKDVNVKPAVAESWNVSADGLTYTYKLRKGVQFSNGDPVKAGDFIYAWNRIVQNEKADYEFVFSDIKGVDAIEKLTGEARKKATIPGVVAPDDYTLQVTLNAPAADFVTRASLWPFYPVDKAVLDKYGDKWTEAGNLVGNGAFLLKEWKHNQSLRLEANPNYWEGRPSVDAITIELIADTSTAKLKYDNGELDSIRVGVADLPKIRNDAKLKPQLVVVPQLRSNWIGFNFDKGPFKDNKELRKAFYQAIDRRVVAEGALQGGGLPMTTLLVPGLLGYKPYEAYPFDPAKAKASLAAAGYDTPEKVKQLEDTINNWGDGGKAGGFAYTPERTGWQQASESYVQQWKQNLGINLKLNADPTLSSFKTRRQTNHEFVIYLGSWGADYPDPADFYQPIFGCGVSNQQGGNYCNKELDTAWKAGQTEFDPAKRAVFYQQAEKILQDDAAMIPTYSGIYSVLIKPNIANWSYSPNGPFPFKDLQIKK